MDVSDYEYTGMMAEAWDLLRGDTSGWADRLFYLELIKQYGQPVLDVGCGTGRLLVDYMAHGVDIDGVDTSPEMLGLCYEKADALGLEPRLYEQPMEELDLPRTYRTILVPSSSLQLLTDPAQAEQALRRIYEHLEPGGAVAASIMLLWKEGQPLEGEEVVSAVRPEDGATVRRVTSMRYDPATECESTADLYQILQDGAVVAEERHRRSPAVRSYTQQQAQQLFERAGFAEVTLYQGFSHAHAQPDDSLFVVVARRP